MGWGEKAIEVRSLETGLLDGVFTHKRAQQFRFLCERNEKVSQVYERHRFVCLSSVSTFKLNPLTAVAVLKNHDLKTMIYLPRDFLQRSRFFAEDELIRLCKDEYARIRRTSMLVLSDNAPYNKTSILVHSS